MKINNAEIASQNDIEQHVIDSDNGTLVLGGNIELQGFTGVGAAQMVVIKKMVGSYVRKITDSEVNPEKVIVSKNGDKINVNLFTGEKEINAEGSNSNLFFGLDSSMSKIMEQL